MAEAAKAADIIMILVGDEKQANLYKESVEPNLTVRSQFFEGKGVPCLMAIHQDASGKAAHLENKDWRQNHDDKVFVPAPKFAGLSRNGD